MSDETTPAEAMEENEWYQSDIARGMQRALHQHLATFYHLTALTFEEMDSDRAGRKVVKMAATTTDGFEITVDVRVGKGR